MTEVLWIRILNEAIPLLLLIAMGFVLYRGFKKNQALLTEREELFKRYLLFRGDKQVRLRIYGDDEKIYKELLRNISNSWKNFKKTYDQCLFSIAQSTTRTKRILQLITLGMFVHSGRLLVEEYYFRDLSPHLFHLVAREFLNYVLVVFGFFLLRLQTQKFLSLKGEVNKMDREILFFPNQQTAEGKQEVLYNEFDPIEGKGLEDEPKDQDPYQ